jgi:hypothetical protein
LRKGVSKPPEQRWRRPLIWASITLATVFLVLGNIFFWTGNTIVNTNRYVAAVGPLIEQPAIQDAMAQYTSSQLFKAVDVQSYVKDTLPPKAAFLAPQLTTQLQSYTQKTLKTALANPKVQQYWYASLTKSHNAIINYSKSYQGNGTIDVSDIFNQLTQRLGGTHLAFLAGKRLPAKIGSINVATVGWLPALHRLTVHIGLYQALATILFLGFSVLAVVLSTKRRRAVIRLAIIYAGFMALTLIAVRVAGGIVVTDVAQMYQSAVQVAYDTVIHSFIIQTRTLLLLSLLLLLGAWISGPYKSATVVKNRITDLLSGHVHQSIFGNRENGFTTWVGRYKAYLQWGSVIVVAFIMILVQLSPKLVALYALLIIVLVLIVDLVAAPKTSQKI